MSAVDRRQGRLDLKVPYEGAADVSDQVVMRQPHFRAAIVLCCQASGLDDGQIAYECDIDTAQFSRILKGKAHFPDEKINTLMDVCDNEIPLRWLAFSRGQGLHALQSKEARERDEALARAEEAEKKLKHFMEFQQGVSGSTR